MAPETHDPAPNPPQAGPRPMCLEDLPPAELRQAIRMRCFDPASLTSAQRRHCVELLTSEGLTADQIATDMGLALRTVQRDRSAIRQAQACEPNLDFCDQALGEYRRLTDESIQRLRSIALDRDAPLNTRLRVEQTLARIYKDFLAATAQFRSLDANSVFARKARKNPADEEARALPE